MPLKQFVNLPKEARFVERGIASVKRLGPAVFETEFQKAGGGSVKPKLVPGSEVTYSDREKLVNPRFTAVGDRGVRVQGDAKAVHEDTAIDLPAAGGNTYRIAGTSGKDEGTSDNVIETWRRLFWQGITMEGVSGNDAVAAERLGELASTAFLEMVDLGPGGSIRHRPCVTGRNARELLLDVKKAYSASHHDPYVIAIVWVDALADRADIEMLWSPGEPGLDKSSRVLTLTSPEALWHGMPDDHPLDEPAPPEEDKPWFRTASMMFLDAAGNYLEHRLGSAAAEVAPSAPRGTRTFQLALPPRHPYPGATLAGVVVGVRVVRQYAAAFKDYNVVMMPTTDAVTGESVGLVYTFYTVAHEVGHKLGMVPSGRGRQLDRRDTSQYFAHGHNGSHCKAGVDWAKPDWSKEDSHWIGTPKCTMFGADAARDAKNPSVRHEVEGAQFCANCQTDLKRLDLSKESSAMGLSVARVRRGPVARKKGTP